MAAVKICAIHPGGAVELSIDNFGICRARKDGRNAYCKECVAAKVKAHRAQRKEWLLVQTQRQRNEIVQRKPYAVARSKTDIVKVLGVSWTASVVFWAINRGARSQSQIKAYVRRHLKSDLDVDEQIGDALGELFGESLIGTVGEDYERVYFRKKAA